MVCLPPQVLVDEDEAHEDEVGCHSEGAEAEDECGLRLSTRVALEGAGAVARGVEGVPVAEVGAYHSHRRAWHQSCNQKEILCIL